jgi:hypothetical protein
VFWGNTNTWSETGQRAQYYADTAYGAIINTTYSCVQGWEGAGAGNTAANPLYAGAAGADGTPGTMDDDLALSAGSPCIDAANSTIVPAGITIDAAAGPRFFDDPGTADTGIGGGGPVVDMGAYEYVPIPDVPFDFNADGDVDPGDLEVFSACFSGPAVARNQEPACAESDRDGDGDVDLADFGRFQGCFSGAGNLGRTDCAN